MAVSETLHVQQVSQPSNLVYMTPEGERPLKIFLALRVDVQSEDAFLNKNAAQSVIVMNSVESTGAIRFNGRSAIGNDILFDCLVDYRFPIGFLRHKDSSMVSVVICLFNNHPTGLRDSKVTICFANAEEAQDFFDIFKMFQQEMRSLIDDAVQKGKSD